MLTDTIHNTGAVRLELIAEDGSVASRVEVPNLVVDRGLAWIAQRMNGQGAALSYMAFGRSGNGVSAGDSGLYAETGRAPLSARVNGTSTTYTATFPPSIATGTLAELGIFTSDGVMLSRTTFPAQNKEASATANVTWTITQSA
jgi:hypothetical protein